MQISDEFWDIPFIKDSGVKPAKEYIIPQAHGDEVVSYPDIFKNYASSDSCKNELIVSNNHRYLLLQGHPEYGPEFGLPRMYKMLMQRTGQTDTSHEALEKLKKTFVESTKIQPDTVVWRSICYSFLKNHY